MLRSIVPFWILIAVMVALLLYASYLALDGPLAARAMAPKDGFEPPTNALTGRRSTVELLGYWGRRWELNPQPEPYEGPALPLRHVAPSIPSYLTSIDEALYIIRNCESGGDYTTDTGNGYYGAYQFSLTTWQAVGGEGYPHLASPQEQDFRAGYLLTHFGAGQWPYCGRLI